jgi:hypothetical protein
MPEPCAYCDTIGPFVRDEQLVRDVHRAFHEVARAWNRAYGPLMKAFARAGEAARATSAASYALAPPTDDTEDTMTTPALPLEAWRVEIGDDVTLIRRMATVGGRVTRIDLSATKGTGFYFYGHGLPHWVGPRHDTWTLAAHEPAIPRVLHAGAVYDITTTDGRTRRAHYSPIDGIRADHPWLHPDGQTRYGGGYVTRARLADTEGSDQ